MLSIASSYSARLNAANALVIVHLQGFFCYNYQGKLHVDIDSYFSDKVHSSREFKDLILILNL